MGFWIAMIFVPFIVGLPNLYLHFEYLFYTRSEAIDFNFQEKWFDVYSKKSKRRHSFQEINQITVYACPSLYKDSTKFMLYEDYHFAVMQLKNRERIVITCFMINPIVPLLNQFDAVNVVYKKVFFPSIALRTSIGNMRSGVAS